MKMILYDDEDLAGTDQSITDDNTDPLEPTSEEYNVETNNDGTTNEEQSLKQKYSQEELQKVISQRQVVDMTDEYMDPIEWTVRKVLHIPEAYYWDVILEEQYDQVPVRTKFWHKTIALLNGAHNWTNRSFAKPLASALGLTDSPFDYVVDTMTDKEWKESKEKVAARQVQYKKEEGHSKHDVEDGNEASTISSS
jgi:heterodisulfide reductase subunit B